MSDLTPEERAARIEIDFTIGPERTARLRADIAREIQEACDVVARAFTSAPIQAALKKILDPMVEFHTYDEKLYGLVRDDIESVTVELPAYETSGTFTVRGPATIMPPSRETVGHVPAETPQDRTRAIVSAAERLAALYESSPGYKSIEASTDGDGLRDALADLARALAIPAPKWTRTPPSEPGLWWCRERSATSLPWKRRLVILERNASGELVERVDTSRNNQWNAEPPPSPVGTWRWENEWWPIPIEPPKETPDVL